MLSFQWIQKVHKPLLEKYHASLNAKSNKNPYSLELSTNNLITDLLSIEAIEKHTDIRNTVLQYHFNVSLALVTDNLEVDYPTEEFSVALYGLLYRTMLAFLQDDFVEKCSMQFAAVDCMRILIEQSIVNKDLGVFSKSKELDILFVCKGYLDKTPYKKDGFIWKGDWVKNDDGIVSPIEAQIWFILFLVLLNGEFEHLTTTRSILLQNMNKHFQGKSGSRLISQIPILEKLWQRISVIGLEPVVPKLSVCEIDLLYDKIQKPSFFSSLWGCELKSWNDIEFFIDNNKSDNYIDYVAPAIDIDLIERMSLRCQCCGEVSQKKCAKCMNIAYCSRDCQAKDWPDHKSRCQQLSTSIE
eukprot:NODE_880_length_3474_cov_0.290074.p1 type:complete len:356 gc:universal NODE_880_length_3474_cov_0.290074:1255-188(-)